jgi:hypothetical protein
MTRTQRLVALTMCLALSWAASAQTIPTKTFSPGNSDDNTKRIIMSHGIFSDGSTWFDNAEALRVAFPFAQVETPNLPWQERLQTVVWALPQQRLVNSLLVGHSQGGVVSRRRAQQGAVQGYVTMGSPQRGAPFADSDNHSLFIQALTTTVIDASNARNYLQYLDGPWTLQDDVYVIADWVAQYWPWLFSYLADLVVPYHFADFLDIGTTSAFIQALNANAAAELDSTAGSLAFTFGQDNSVGLFWRLLFSAAPGAEWLQYSLASTVTTAVYSGGYNFLEVAAEAWDQMWNYGGEYQLELELLYWNALYAGYDLLYFDVEYCWDISEKRIFDYSTGGWYAGTCRDSDGFIPRWSQSSAHNIIIDRPHSLHTGEIASMVGVLAPELARFGILNP